MADPTTPTPGTQTSEYSLTKYAMVVGTILEVLSGTLEQLQASGLVHDGGTAAHVVAGALIVSGLLMQVCGLFGYQHSRTTIKVAQLQASTAVVAQAKALTQPSGLEVSSNQVAQQSACPNCGSARVGPPST